MQCHITKNKNESRENLKRRDCILSSPIFDGDRLGQQTAYKEPKGIQWTLQTRFADDIIICMLSHRYQDM